MPGLVFACIAPHGSLAIPLIAGPEGEKASATRAAMETLAERMAAAQPETVVLITPHGVTLDGDFSLLDTRRLRGVLSGNGNELHLELAVDRELNAAIVSAARRLEVPVTRVGYGPPEAEGFALPLDFGAAVPLYYFGASRSPQPQVVVTCAGTAFYRDAPPGSGHARAMLVRYGRALREAAEQAGRRVAFVASADLGHAHDQASRYGYDPISAEFDHVVAEAVQAQDLRRLLDVEPTWLRRARTDAFVQLLTLHGLLEGTTFQGELLSYEVPTYYGMLCAAYAAPR